MVLIINHNKVIGLQRDLNNLISYMYKYTGSLNLSHQQAQAFVRKEVQAWIRLKLKECQSPQETKFLRQHLKKDIY